VGAAHQTGWTGLVAKLLMPRYSAEIHAAASGLQLPAEAGEKRPLPGPTEARRRRQLYSNP
jgi:GMP synthase PP-ATPase subunit